MDNIKVGGNKTNNVADKISGVIDPVGRARTPCRGAAPNG